MWVIFIGIIRRLRSDLEVSHRDDVSHSLNSLNGGYIGDYIGDYYYRGY